MNGERERQALKKKFKTFRKLRKTIKKKKEWMRS